MIRCPRCSEVLVRRRAGAVELDGCTTCGGSFFDQGELTNLVKDPALLASVDAIFRPTREALAPKRSDTCPRCTTAMTPFEQPSMPGIQLDACRTCKGIWLDGGEATAIATRRGYVAPAPVVAAPRAAPAAAPLGVAPSPASPHPMLSGEARTWSILAAVALSLGLLFVAVDLVRWKAWTRTEATFEGHSVGLYGVFGPRSARSRPVVPRYRFQLGAESVEGRGGMLTVPFWLVFGHERGARVPIVYNPAEPTHVMERDTIFWDLLSAATFCGLFLYRARQHAGQGD